MAEDTNGNDGNNDGDDNGDSNSNNSGDSNKTNQTKKQDTHIEWSFFLPPSILKDDKVEFRTIQLGKEKV